ncbi:MAG TPA: VCBS repeat-containing protein [Terracidiphilus sp.]|nr:VCBS repeat-containing protein [Terracidiphilus sp.]
MRVADVNGDGHPDLIASSEIAFEPNYQYTAGNTVSVALGDGKGNFGLARIYGGSSEAESLAIGDFKGDGRPSIVTADIDTDTATVFPNDGNGGNGFPQGIYACQTNSGTYVCPYVLNYGSGYTFADLNGDGKPDIFEIGFDTSSHYYTLSFLNDGSGHFGASLASPLDTNNTITLLGDYKLGDYKLGDFRHTGHLDLVGIGTNTAYKETQQLIVFQPGNGDGTFGNAKVTPVSGADGLMATGDFNGDGKLDFVAVNGAQSHLLTTFLGNGDGTFRTGASLSFSDTNNDIARVFASDFNRDGKLDILVFATSNGYGTTGSVVWEFDGNGDGTFQAGRELLSGFQPMTLADINNDGHPDIVRFDFFLPDGISIRQSPQITNYLGQADGTFQQVSSYAPYSDPPVAPWPYEQMGDPLTVSVTGDYNGDGKIDEVAFQVGLPAYAQMLMGNGDGTFTPTYDVFPFVPYLYPEYGHDLDGDGFTDMVSLDLGSGGMMMQRGAPASALQIALADPIVTTGSGCGAIFPNLISSSDRSVSLSSTVRGVVLPGSITIPASATYAKFCLTLDGTYDPHQVFDVTATMDGNSATTYGSQAYEAPFAASVAPTATTPVYAGQDTPPVTVTVRSQAQYAGGTVQFGCQGLPAGYICEFNPSQAALAPASSISTTLVVHTAAGTPAYTPIAVIADDGQVLQRASVTLNIAVLGFSQVSEPVIAATPGTGTEWFSVSGIPPYTFSCSGLPAGATCSFSGTQSDYPSLSAISASITLPAGVTPGTSPFKVIVSREA